MPTPTPSRPVARATPHAGFTLVEMIVAVAILAVGTAFAVPAFANLVASQRLTAAANDVVSVFHQARTAAIAGRSRVVVCPADEEDDCIIASDWRRAISFVDENRNGLRDSGDRIVGRWDFMDTPVRMARSAGPTSGRVAIGATGLILPGAGGAGTQLRLCDDRLVDRSNLVEVGVGGARTWRGDGNGCS